MTAPVPTGLTAWLDELDAAHKAATPGPWRRHGEHLVVDERGVSLIAAKVWQDDAAAIVAEHNATPKLTAALRAVLALHRSEPGPYGDVCACCIGSDEGNLAWPCPTYSAAVAAAHTEEGR